MTAIIPTRQGKAKAIATLRTALAEYLFPYASNGDINLILAHLAWMSRQPEVMLVKAHFDTFPGIKSTRLTLDLNFEQNPATEAK